MPHRPRTPKGAAKLLEGGMKLFIQTGNSRQTKFKKTKPTGSYSLPTTASTTLAEVPRVLVRARSQLCCKSIRPESLVCLGLSP